MARMRAKYRNARGRCAQPTPKRGVASTIMTPEDDISAYRDVQLPEQEVVE